MRQEHTPPHLKFTNNGATQIIETEKQIQYSGLLPDGSYGIARQDKYIHNIYGDLKKTPARLLHDFERRSYQNGN